MTFVTRGAKLFAEHSFFINLGSVLPSFISFSALCLQDSHGMQGRGGLARRTVSFGDKCRRQLTDFGWEIRTIPPKWQQPHSPPGSHTEQLLREE